jgi:hypothetical protein
VGDHDTYQLGEPMFWWGPDNPKHSNWLRDGGRPESDIVRECCYADCTSCSAKLYVVLQFRVSVPESVLDVGLEENWPSSFPR